MEYRRLKSREAPRATRRKRAREELKKITTLGKTSNIDLGGNGDDLFQGCSSVMIISSMPPRRICSGSLLP